MEQNTPQVLDDSRAAMFLGVSENSLWRLVHDGLLKPTTWGPDAWTFSRVDLEQLKSWYKQNSLQRKKIGIGYLVAGVLLIALSLCCAVSNRVMPDWLSKFLFCFASGFLGLSFRALWLMRKNLEPPRHDYFTYFLFVVLLNATLTFAVLHVLPGVAYSPVFFALAWVTNVVLGVFAHPEFWIVPKWLGSK